MVKMSVRELYNKSRQKLQDNCIDNSSNEAGFIIESVCGISKNQLPVKGDRQATENEIKVVNRFTERRTDGEPLQYILGEWEFYGFRFNVGKGVLIPRPDTETLVDEVIKRIYNIKSPCILDICSGSGCIAVTLDKKVPDSNVYALEKSPDALEYLKQNISFNGCDINVVHCDATDKRVTENLPQFDCIVSNPPYLTRQDMQDLQREVKSEPSMALYGGDDGLYFYKTLTMVWKEKIKENGLLIYEIGINQESDVKNILKSNGFKDIFTADDLCGITRVVGGYR